MITDYTQNTREQINLHKTISIPSDVHIYSLAIEYMRNWFLSKFDDDYFKTIYVNGKYIMDDYSRFNREKLTKIEKPAVAIVPSIDFEYDRDTIDLKLGGKDILTRRSRFFQDAVIQDYDNNLFFGVNFKQHKINFSFRIRVSTKAQQIDLANFVRYSHRVKATQGENVSYDFHIPQEIILNIARHAGFDIVKDNTKGSSYKVKNIIGFLSYLNQHSVAPILYKLRTINGNPEFFFRTLPLYTHISNLEDLSIDEGERTGQIDKDFMVEMNCTLLIPGPQYYYYYSKEEISKEFEMKKKLAGLYEFRHIVPPEKNEKGWREYLSTEWLEPTCTVKEINYAPLLENNELMQVIEHTKRQFISPAIFLDFKLYNGREEIPIKVDWERNVIIVDKILKDETSQITMYVDLEYMNNSLIAIKDLNSNRMNSDSQKRQDYQENIWDNKTNDKVEPY